jgi:PAS domain-containing protein
MRGWRDFARPVPILMVGIVLALMLYSWFPHPALMTVTLALIGLPLVWKTASLYTTLEENALAFQQTETALQHERNLGLQVKWSLNHNENRLRQLHEIASEQALEPGQRLEALLRLGTEAFGLEAGLLAQVRYDARHLLEDGPDLEPFGFEQQFEHRQVKLEVMHRLALNGSVVSDLELELARTVIHAAKPTLWRDHIGVPVQVQGRLYGCLSFSKRAATDSPKQIGIGQTGIEQIPFNTYDEEFLKLMGQWVEHELERIESEQRLLERTEQLNAVIKVSPDGFLIMDEDGHITDVNPALLEMTGLGARRWSARPTCISTSFCNGWPIRTNASRAHARPANNNRMCCKSCALTRASSNAPRGRCVTPTGSRWVA